MRDFRLFYSDEFIRHVQWPGHPESPDRIMAIEEKMEEYNLWNPISPEEAGEDSLLRVHSEEYLRMLKLARRSFIDSDTALHPETYPIAVKAAGAAIMAADSALSNGTAFSLVRPPGHHAGRDYAMGFCYINNIAVAASYLLSRGVKRVAIVDIDVHHGNGTSDIFYSSESVLYISTHQRGIFPGTGAASDTGMEQGAGYNINIPFPSGAGDSSFFTAFERIVLPALFQYSPDVILISMGADAHYMDPLAGLSLSSAGYVELIKWLNNAAERMNIGLALTLEGGYHIKALAEVVTGIVSFLSRGEDIDFSYDLVQDKAVAAEKEIEEAVEIQKEFWKID